jgi:hypothetical protein
MYAKLDDEALQQRLKTAGSAVATGDCPPQSELAVAQAIHEVTTNDELKEKEQYNDER